MRATESESRPGLAIVTNAVTPYQLNLQRLIAAGIPELKLHVLVSHSTADFNWNIDIPPEICLTRWGETGEHPLDNPLRNPRRQWNKGGNFIRYFGENQVRAAIFVGYRHISYLRLMNYCRHHGIPFFSNADNNIRSELPLSPLASFAKRRTYNWWMKRASGVMSMGKLGDQFFLKYGFDTKRLYRVPYWPDFEAYSSVDEQELARFIQKFGLGRQRRRLLFSGRLVPVKRVDLLIDAFAAMAAERPDWDLLIIGDGELREQLQGRVPESLRKRVVWTGFLEGKELAVAYHAADVLVLPSDYENWAVVVQEAMSAGLTIVASDVVGAAHEMIVDGKSGRVFAKGDGESLRNSLADITSLDRIDDYRAEAVQALRKYREEVDPVAEIRRALMDTSVLPITAPEVRR